MLKETISIDQTIEVLNEIIRLDPEAISKLVSVRVKCNTEIANHPTVQVAKIDNDFTVGLLGVINGLFGIDNDGWGAIAAELDDNELITKFVRTDTVKTKFKTEE